MSIAPHEHNEVRLVLGGLKPLATIEKSKDPIGYSLAIALSNTGSLVTLVRPTRDCPAGECITVAAHNRELIPQYLDLLENGITKFGIKEYHRRMGRMFGYSEKDIQDFIDSNINCNCSKCRGY